MQTRPNPGSATTPEEFLEALRQLRAWAGQPSLRTLNTLAGTDPDSGVPPADLLPVSTLSDNLAGKRLPNPPRLSFVVAFVTACMRADGSYPEEQIATEADRWTQAWLALSPDTQQPPVLPSTPAPEDTILQSAPVDTILDTAPTPEDAIPEAAVPEVDLPRETTPAPPTRKRAKRRLPVMAWLLGAATGAAIVALITLVTTDTSTRAPAASTESRDVSPAPGTPPPPTRAEPTPSEPAGSTPVVDHRPRPEAAKPAPTPSPSASKRPSSPPSRPAPSTTPPKSSAPAPYPSYYDSWKSYIPTFPPRP
ncbi:hypothetical protein ACFHW2_15980 [Actinomadura sp. LOL_016]|uniref:hypothetical protein n=1 Tax=unclassified Actinomadura TaxID=2626254 RepID=UPI003A80DE87